MGSQFGRRVRAEQPRAVGVLLQPRRGDVGGRRVFDGATDDGGFVGAGREHEDAAGGDEVGDAERHRARGDALEAAEGARVRFARRRRKRDDARGGVGGGWRLVEGDVSVRADAEHAEVEAARAADRAGEGGDVLLRLLLEARQGSRFNLRAFHDQFLSYGSIPVTLIAQAMEKETSRA